MKILLITPTFSPDVGGVEAMLSKFCDYLAKRKFQANIITYNPLIAKAKAPFKEKFNEYVTIWRIPWVGRGLFNVFEHYPPIQFLYLVPALLVTVMVFLLNFRWRPDIIHGFGLSGAFAGGVSSRIYKIPCIVDMCTVYRFPERPVLAWFVRRILAWCDYIRANNPHGKEELEKIGIDSNKIGLITPPVDELYFKPIRQELARRYLKIPQKNFIALFVARMVYCKRVEIAIAATKLINNPRATFVFIGEGPLQSLVEKAAKRDKRIVFIGNVKHENLLYYYNAADVLMCAPVETGIVSWVGREALMCGLPILAPKTGVAFGVTFSVDKNLFPSEVGLFFEVTPKDLAKNLRELIRQKENGGIISMKRKACREFALTNYSSRAMDWLGDSYDKTIKLRFK